MSRPWTIGLAAVGLLLSWSAVAAPPQSSPSADAPYRFVGYSSNLVAGDVGLPTLYAACQDLFGPEAMMCTSEEFIRSPNIYAPGAANAWLRPTFVGFDNANGAAALDVSGLIDQPNSNFTCRAWTTVIYTGLVVTADGGIASTIVEAECVVPRQVTCCAPLQ